MPRKRLGYMKEVGKKVEAKPGKVKAPSATPTRSVIFLFSMDINNAKCVCVYTEHRGENTPKSPCITMDIKAS